MTEYDTLNAGGSYAKWETVGDTVEGRIGAFSPDGGSDFDGNPCPELIVETDAGNVVISGGQANLRRQFTQNAAKFIVGHGVKVTYSGNYKTKHGTSGKEFTIGVSKEPIAPIVVELDDDEAPFVAPAGEWWPQAQYGAYPERMLP